MIAIASGHFSGGSLTELGTLLHDDRPCSIRQLRLSKDPRGELPDPASHGCRQAMPPVYAHSLACHWARSKHGGTLVLSPAAISDRALRLDLSSHSSSAPITRRSSRHCRLRRSQALAPYSGLCHYSGPASLNCDPSADCKHPTCIESRPVGRGRARGESA